MNSIINLKDKERRFKVEGIIFIAIVMLSVLSVCVNALVIGGRDNDYYDGSIDEVKIYNYSLSGEQVYQNYIEGLNGYTNSTITANTTELNETWNCTVTPNDATSDGTTLSSSWMRIEQDDAPTLTGLNTNATNLTKRTETINLSAICTDDIGAGQIWWSKYNGSVYQNGTSVNYVNNNIYTFNVTINEKRNADVNLSVYCNDSAGQITQSGWIGFTVKDTAPTHTTPLISTPSGNNLTTENITCVNQSTYDADCYDSETEILTSEGWKLFKDLNKDEEVMTLNQETGKQEWQKPSAYQEYDVEGDMFRIETENGDLLVSPEHKVYAKVEDYLIKNISTKSGVEYTLTSSCFLKSSSPDQIAQPKCSANAKYGTSLGCGDNFSALDCISTGNLYIGNISILSLRISNASITSDLEVPQILAITPMFLLNSSIKYGNATNFNLSSKNKSLVLPLPIIAANKTVASTTSSIYFASRNLLATDSEILSVNSLATLSDTLNLDENFFSFFNFSALSNIAFLATSDQSNLNSFIVLSNSSGNSIDSIPILSSPCTDIENGYLNLLEYKLIPITEIYNNLDKEIYFLDSENKPIKVKNITKENYKGRIYDVDVDNNIVLVRRNNLITWSGNSDHVTNIYNWYRNGSSIMVLNMPFDTNTTSTTAGAVKDYSHYVNNGTISSITGWNNTCIQGGCYIFEGVDDSINITDTGSLNLSTVSIEFWFNPNDDYDTSTDYVSLVYHEDYELFIDDGVMVFNYSGNRLNSTTNKWDKGKWYHILATYDGSTQAIYVNGSQERNATISEFGISNNAGTKTAAFYSSGNIILRGSCNAAGVGGCKDPGDDAFIVHNGSDYVGYINSTGDLCIEDANCNFNDANCNNPVDKSFIIMDSNNRIVSYINRSGDLCLIGGLTENGNP